MTTNRTQLQCYRHRGAVTSTTAAIAALMISMALQIPTAHADDSGALDGLISGLHQDAHEGNFDTYFDRYTPDAVFLGTDKTERWTIDEFKRYAEPAFADGHGWTYKVVERHWEGSGDTRWFDEVLLNAKLGHCRGTGVVRRIDGEWKIAHYALTMLVPNVIAAEVGSQTRRTDGVTDTP